MYSTTRPSPASDRACSIIQEVSLGASADVASSKMTMSGRAESTFAASTRWRSAIDRSRTSEAGSMAGMPSSSNSSAVRRRIRRSSTRPRRSLGSWPIQTFSATLRSGTSDSSWKITPTRTWALPVRARTGSSSRPS
jgi:hypothetical protein